MRSNLRAHFRTREEFEAEMDRIELAIKAEEYRREAATRVSKAALARHGWRLNETGKPEYVGEKVEDLFGDGIFVL